MRSLRWISVLAVCFAALVLGGCASSPGGPMTAPLDSPAVSDGPATPTEAGAGDSVGSTPGSPDAKFRYRFKQTEPGSDRFTFFDRDVSFYFRPAPDALHFQIENKQDRMIWIDWDRSRVLSPDGASGKLAHAGTEFRDRFGSQTPVQLRGLQRYSDYVLPIEYLIDPGASADQLHRPLLPEDESAPNYNGREFGVDLAMRIDNQPRTYSFRFKVVSVLPR